MKSEPGRVINVSLGSLAAAAFSGASHHWMACRRPPQVERPLQPLRQRRLRLLETSAGRVRLRHRLCSCVLHIISPRQRLRQYSAASARTATAYRSGDRRTSGRARLRGRADFPPGSAPWRAGSADGSGSRAADRSVRGFHRFRCEIVGAPVEATALRASNSAWVYG